MVIEQQNRDGGMDGGVVKRQVMWLGVPSVAEAGR